MARRRSKGLRLFVFRGEHLTIAPLPDRLFIGRHRQAHIRIRNGDVNLKHAVIERIGTSEKFRLLDFGTTIPTLVNGEATGDTPLDFGDQIEIADVYIYFDRVRKDAPEEHRVAFDNLLEMEQASRGARLGVAAPQAAEEDEEFDDTEELEGDEAEVIDDAGVVAPRRRGRGRRRLRTGLKSTARRRRNAKGL